LIKPVKSIVVKYTTMKAQKPMKQDWPGKYIACGLQQYKYLIKKKKAPRIIVRKER
jgi:hypothetical protein